MGTTINDVRLSYCNLFQAVPPFNNPNGEPKYSVTVLVPKSNVAAKATIDAAIEAAIGQGVSKSWGGVRPPQPAICVHDGDGVRPTDGMPYGAECKGCWVFTAASKNAPFVVDENVKEIIDPRAVYSGIWGNISVNFYAYNNTKKGIGCGLNGVQKTRDGEPLVDRTTAEDAFGAAAGGAMPATPGYAAPGYAAAAPVYAPPAAPAAPVYAPPAAPVPGYAPVAPGYYIDPLTGQPVAYGAPQ